MYRLLFIIFFLFTTGTLSAQTDTLASKNYHELSDIIRQYQYKDTTSALAVTRYYIEKAISEKQTEREWEGIYTMGMIHYQERNLKYSIKYENKLLDFINNDDPEAQALKFETYFSVGAFNLHEGTLGRALNYFTKAKDEAKQNDNLNQLQRSYFMINLIQAMSGDFENAINTQKELLFKIAQTDTNNIKTSQREELYFRVYSSLGDTYLKAKNADSSRHYAAKALNEIKKTNDTCRIKYAYRLLSDAYIENKLYAKAKKYVDSSTLFCRPFSKRDSLMLGGLYGKIYLGQGDYKKSISALENGINSYNVLEGEEGFMDDLYYVLATAYKEDGNIEQAGYYLGKHIHSQNEYAFIKDTIQQNFREQEINSFKAELNKLEQEKESQKSNLNYLLLAGSIIILTLLFFLLKFYRSKKANEVKFEALLSKIQAAKSPSEIIDTKDEVLEEKATSDVSPEVTAQILDGLKKLEEKEYFLKQECNSYNVAKKINTNTSYLSKVINSHYGKNFNTYINDLRINYAIVRLKNDVFFRSFSIQAIAEEVGYKSADSFTKYFKKDTGLNPSFYIKNIKNIT
ncbi:transcriptional regulator [unidentified eubacterium SCB49]|nr:transcriptional regulator [unidentified eubacterium SCB49]